MQLFSIKNCGLFEDNIGEARVGADGAGVKQRAIVDLVRVAAEDFARRPARRRCRSFPPMDGLAVARRLTSDPPSRAALLFALCTFTEYLSHFANSPNKR